MLSMKKPPFQAAFLFRCRIPALLVRFHGDVGAVIGLGLEHDLAGFQREEGVILAGADIRARPELVAALAHEDIPREHRFTAVFLYAEPAANRIAAVG